MSLMLFFSKNRMIFPIILLLAFFNVFSEIAHSSQDLRKGSTETDRLLQACNSKDPVLVIDSFPFEGVVSVRGFIAPALSNSENPRGRIIDVDGDGIADFYHGEFIEHILNANGYLTDRFIVKSRYLPEIAEALEPLVLSIERGERKVSRINLSQEKPLKLSIIKKDLYPNDPTFPEITAENISHYSDKILEHFWKHGEQLKLRELHDLFSRLQNVGVPVVVAAGNFDPNHVNIFSLMPGVITVGALDHKGNKLFASADNAYVRWWANGVVTPTEVEGGLDLNGDGTVDVAMDSVSAGDPIVNSYIGKVAEELTSEVNDEFRQLMAKGAKGFVPNAALNTIEFGLYRVEDLVNLPTVTQGTANIFRSLGSYVLKIKKDVPPQYFFDVDENGRLKFNPSGNDRDGQRSRISGTSFAAPIICEYIKQQ